MQMSEDTRIIDLNVGELQQLIASELAKIQVQTNQVSQDSGWCRGLQEFADFLGCSLGTANKIKSSGKIDDAVCQYGRMIMINKSRALELIKMSNVLKKIKK